MDTHEFDKRPAKVRIRSYKSSSRRPLISFYLRLAGRATWTCSLPIAFLIPACPLSFTGFVLSYALLQPRRSALRVAKDLNRS